MPAYGRLLSAIFRHNAKFATFVSAHVGATTGKDVVTLYLNCNGERNQFALLLRRSLSDGLMAYNDKFITCTCGRIYRIRHFHESSLQYNEFTCACGFVLYCWHEEASYQFRLEGFQSPKPN